MQNLDTIALEERYGMISEKTEDIFIPRRSREDRMRSFKIATEQKIAAYIKNGYKGGLDLSHTPVTSLPAGLVVEKNLGLYGSKIESLPEGLWVGECMNVSETPLASLPEGMRIGKNLFLSDTKITALPSDLVVKGSLYLGNAPIVSMASDLKVGGTLYLVGTPLMKNHSYEEIHEMVPHCRNIDISRFW